MVPVALPRAGLRPAAPHARRPPRPAPPPRATPPDNAPVDSDGDGAAPAPKARRGRKAGGGGDAADAPRLEPRAASRLRSQLRRLVPDPDDDPMFDAADLESPPPPPPDDPYAPPRTPGLPRRGRSRSAAAAADGASPDPWAGVGGGAAGDDAFARRSPALPPDGVELANLTGAARDAALHDLLVLYRRAEMVDIVETDAMRLMTEQRGREVGVYQQTVAMASFLQQVDTAPPLPNGEDRLPDWITATYALERIWPAMQAEADIDKVRTRVTEEWSPDLDYALRVEACDPALLDGVHDDDVEVEGPGDPLDALMEGVLPGVD